MGAYNWRIVRHNCNGYKGLTWAGPGWYVLRYMTGGFDCWPEAMAGEMVGMRTYLDAPDKLLTPTAAELARATARVKDGAPKVARAYEVAKVAA